MVDLPNCARSSSVYGIKRQPSAILIVDGELDLSSAGRVKVLCQMLPVTDEVAYS